MCEIDRSFHHHLFSFFSPSPFILLGLLHSRSVTINNIHPPPKKGSRDKRKTGEKGRGSFALDDLTHFAPHAPFFSCFFYLESRESLVRRSARFLQDCLFLERMRRKLEDGIGRFIVDIGIFARSRTSIPVFVEIFVTLEANKQASFFLFFFFISRLQFKSIK